MRQSSQWGINLSPISADNPEAPVARLVD